jgi:hypothetical protein
MRHAPRGCGGIICLCRSDAAHNCRQRLNIKFSTGFTSSSPQASTSLKRGRQRPWPAVVAHFKPAPRAKRKREQESVILLQRPRHDTINLATATQREPDPLNDVLVQCTIEFCSLAPFAGRSSVSSSPFRAKAGCPRWTYLPAMCASRWCYESASVRRLLRA